MHIIDFTVPYPADYGGVIDLFWKLPALQQQGVHIHLHCFDYGRGRQAALQQYCAEVNYYDRSKFSLSSLPSIVATRKNEELLQRLLQDNYPIFMEGIQSTYLLQDERFTQRRKFVRVHNVEYQYYHELYKSASGLIDKIYFARESNLLKKYEHKIATKATAYWSVTEKDAVTYRTEFNCKNIDHLPLFLPNNWEVTGKPGIGNYCLYQGDLSVPANAKAVEWLVKEVFSTVEIPFVVAGKNPSKKLEDLLHKQNHTCLVPNPSLADLQDVVAKAHINILPSFSSSGIKLKLLQALYQGRHCLVNQPTIEGSGLDSFCELANTAKEMQEKLTWLYTQPYSEEQAEQRLNTLPSLFNNTANAQQMVKWIWG